MHLILTASDCVIVSKNKRKGSDGKEYCRVGVSQSKRTTGELNLPTEDYDRITDDMFYQPVSLNMEYIETKNGAFLKLYDIVPGAGSSPKSK